MARKTAPLNPLRDFNYRLVKEKLDGLPINVDRDLQRKAKDARASVPYASRFL